MVGNLTKGTGKAKKKAGAEEGPGMVRAESHRSEGGNRPVTGGPARATEAGTRKEQGAVTESAGPSGGFALLGWNDGVTTLSERWRRRNGVYLVGLHRLELWTFWV
jgi:hypothetical protein